MCYRYNLISLKPRYLLQERHEISKSIKTFKARKIAYQVKELATKSDAPLSQNPHGRRDPLHTNYPLSFTQSCSRIRMCARVHTHARTHTKIKIIRTYLFLLYNSQDGQCMLHDLLLKNSTVYKSQDFSC